MADERKQHAAGWDCTRADCHLEYTRLSLALGDKDTAREHLTTAREMIERMGYHRRDKDLAELEKML